MVENDTVLWIVGFMFTAGVQTFALVRFLVNRMDSQHKELEDQMNGQVVALHERVNVVKDEYVKRVDLDRDLSGLKELILSIKADTHKAMGDIKSDQHQMMTQINSRLDALAGAVANIGSNS